MNKLEFQKLLDTHDWYYSSTEDMRIWNRGVEEERTIKLAMTERDDLYSLYKKKRDEIFPNKKGA